MKRITLIIAAALLSLSAGVTYAQQAESDAASMSELLELIRQGQARDSQEARQREARFTQARNQQQHLLNQALAARMRKLQPRIEQLKERYGDDRQRMSQAMMELYKKEKINPLGGCLPILEQIPVFIALYWVLLESVELRQASFMLWLNDLSSPDPFYVLPLLMGATMLIQQKLNPAPLDPIQAKVMMVLPVVFTVFFAFFPSGLVLYWVTNTLLSIAQQWRINKVVERGN